MPWPKGTPYSAEHIAKRSQSVISSGTRRKKPVHLEGRTYWKCGTCETYKPEGEFYIDGKTASGVSSVCRACHCKGSMRTRDPENARRLCAEHMRRARRADPEKFRARERAYSARRREIAPEKVLARNLLNSAVKRGAVIKPDTCAECCRSAKIYGHHEDYSRPLDVVWLCATCHGKRHRVVEFKRVTA